MAFRTPAALKTSMLIRSIDPNFGFSSIAAPGSNLWRTNKVPMGFSVLAYGIVVIGRLWISLHEREVEVEFWHHHGRAILCAKCLTRSAF